MATFNLRDISVGLVSIQTGSGGTPDHTASSGTTYLDTETGVLYTNTNNAAGWSVTDIRTLGLLSLWGGLPFFNSFSSQTFSVVNLSATTIYSGSTPLSQVFSPSGVTAYVQPGLNITTGGTPTAPIINVAGSPSFTAVTASNFVSGATNLNNLFAASSVQNQWVQQGNNITTGGTQNAPSVHLVASPRVLHLISSGVTYAPTLSGNTIYSGANELGGLLAQAYAPISVVATYVQPGVNTYTGGTITRPIVGVIGSPILTGLTAQSISGTSISGVSISGVSITATTFSSGATELSIALSNKFNSAYAPITVQNQWVQPGNNISTGGTQNAPRISLVASPSVLHLISSGVTYAPTLSGNTIYSGANELGGLLAQVYAPISVVATYVQPGVNITTGGTITRPIVHVAGSPVFTAVTASSVSGTSVSATTIYSGKTNIQSMFALSAHTHVSADVTDASYGGDPLTSSNKLLRIGPDGSISAVTTGISVYGHSSADGVGVQGYSVEGSGIVGYSPLGSGVNSYSSAGTGVVAYSEIGVGLAAASSALPLLVSSFDVGLSNTIAQFDNNNGPVLYIGNDGALEWPEGGAAITRTNLGLSSVFVSPGLNAYTGSTLFNTIVGIIGSPVFTAVTASQVSGTSVSATTFYSGSTPLNTILSSLGAGSTTYVQPGSNITTGGTATAPIVSVTGSPTFTAVKTATLSANTLTAGTTYLKTSVIDERGFAANGVYYKRAADNEIAASGDMIFDEDSSVLTVSGTINGGTFLSGGTSFNDILSSLGGGATTYVQPGSNITTGGTATAPIVSVTGSPTFTGVKAASVSGTSVSATTFYSGSTPLNTILSSLGAGTTTYVQPGLNINTGGTPTAPVVNLNTVIGVSSVSTGELFVNGYAEFQSPILIQNNAFVSFGSIIFSASGSLFMYDVPKYQVLHTVESIGNPYQQVTGNGNFVYVPDDDLLSAGNMSADTVQFDASLIDKNPSNTASYFYLKESDDTVITTDSLQFDSGNANLITNVRFTAPSYYSGATDLNHLFGPSTYVQPGVNVTTGGTPSRPIIHVSGSPVFTAVSALSVSGTSVSATTFYSGSTNLNYLLGQSSGTPTYVQPGLNITTGGTPSAPIVNLAGSTALTAITFSSHIRDSGANFATGVYYKNSSTEFLTTVNRFTYDSGLGLVALTNGPEAGVTTNGGFTGGTLQVTSAKATSVSGTSVSATTFYSGSTNLNYLLGGVSSNPTYVQPGLNITTGGTASAPIVNLAGSISLTAVTATDEIRARTLVGTSTISGNTVTANTLVSITSNITTLNATTINSGGTNLSSIFAPSSVQNQWMQNGNQTTTGGTINAPKIDLVASPRVNNLISSGVTFAPTLSGTSIYEGSTLLSSKYAPKDLSITLSGGTYILALTDDSRLVDMSGSSAQSLVVPRNAAVAFPIGSQVMVAQTGAGQVSFSADTGVTILSYNSLVKLTGLYATASLVKKDTNTWLLGGNLSA